MEIDVRITTYQASRQAIHNIRDTVFGEEQEVPRRLDWDGLDPTCVHVLAVDNHGRPTGAGRMQPDGRIGRMAVLKEMRGRGIGSRMVSALVEEAGRAGLRQVYLHSQLQAVSFYEACGFCQTGEAFMEAGIRHVTMTCAT